MPDNNKAGKTLRLFVDYEQVDTDEAEDDSDSRDTYIDVTFLNVYRAMGPDAPFFYSSAIVDRKTHESEEVCLVVVRYTTGDTFGTTHGAWAIEGIYSTPTEADKVVQKIQQKTYSGYKPWEGYFERLEEVYIESFATKSVYND